ncbi:uncharacterized protein PV07_06315 [Cladophialophora immunda]|uniref:Ig-like domain-containing protein n=1 Tax=Cladophialophora immunda TaxID=569365 RepID=A0A0D2D4H7_9EURO|nr:uncharacterized protein PV07_06315 [Cladophialophora immunda]KIW30579.1 hypothetical protein PV07_06315 [Cladophialophora immunda]
MKLLYLLPLFLVLVSADDHPETEDPEHSSTVQVSTSTHHSETEHTSTMPITTSTHHSETEHTSTTPSSTRLSGASHTSSTSYSFSNGIMTTTTRPSSTGVVCRTAGSAGTHSLTVFCPMLSAHPTHTGMMGGGGMMGSEYECPDYEGSGYHYTMNMMGSNPMCCTSSATLTSVGSSMGCCPCGSICTGTVPRVQNWYTAAGQVVLTTGTIPSTATAAPTATVTVVQGGAGGSLLQGTAYLNLPFIVGSLILAVLLGSELFF